MRLYKFISLIFCVSLLPGFVLAKDVQFKVKMIDIQVEKTSEKGDDELYFNIVQQSNLNGNRENRIPEFPTHWLSKQLASLKNVVLWEGKVQAGESIKLILSLLEQDTPPWNPDDAIGAAEVNLLNQNGKLTVTWTVPIFKKNNPKVEMLKPAKTQQYIFKGDGSRYDVAFSVEQK